MGLIPPFHTNTDEYGELQRHVFHDQSECGYGQRIKRDNNAVQGDAGRDRCERCEELAAA